MKTEGQVRQQLKQVLFRHLQRKLKGIFRKIPETCVHNETMGKVCFCGLNSFDQKSIVVCDSSVTGCIEKAKSCPAWKARRTKIEIKEEFRTLVAGNFGRIAIEYPDVAALLWVLGSEGLEHDLDEVVGSHSDQDVTP
jgi:hypothetical protein